ncbi:hypothetical protein [Vulcanisaeta thermophila]|uniref:hypothetical protein n=1 Tax=Vulcanisaeta thermophila TaxID=867917 RepID=UPI001181037A|nr:hypothetical protein [Vulcanisaeta thermophila]
MSLVSEILDGIFNDLINKGFIVEVRRRFTPLVSDYVIKYPGECGGVENIDDDLALEREWNWYEVLSLGVGSKLGFNRIIFSMSSPDNNTINISFKLMSGERLKSTEELYMVCGNPPQQSMHMYGKSIIDALLNEDVIERVLGMVRDRRKITNKVFDDIIKMFKNIRSSVDNNLRRLVSAYSWFEV